MRKLPLPARFLRWLGDRNAAPTTRYRRWLVALVGVALVVSLAAWWHARDTLPRRIVIAAGPAGGMYDQLSTALAQELRMSTGRPVEVLHTEGSGENGNLLRSGRAHLAVVQAEGVSTRGLAVLAPLFPDVVHVLVRKERGIHTLSDLTGRRVAIGPERSGTRAVALWMLERYGVVIRQEVSANRHFKTLLTDNSLDAGIITTGVLNPDLRRVLETGRFQLLPVPNAGALSLHQRFLSAYRIPAGAILTQPPVPPQPVETIATTALLVSRSGAGERLVSTALESLDSRDVLEAVPSVLPFAQARVWSAVPLHPTARAYFNPADNLDNLNKFLGALSAGKELLFALGAGIFLVWERWKHLREREHEAEVRAAKEKLDHYVQESVRIERFQMGVWDREVLTRCLDDLTRVKLEALDLLTHEALRGDSLFLIFLTQCASLMQKIQLKLEIGEPLPAGEGNSSPECCLRMSEAAVGSERDWIPTDPKA